MTTNFYPIKCNPCALCIADRKQHEGSLGEGDLVDSNETCSVSKVKSNTNSKNLEITENQEELSMIVSEHRSRSESTVVIKGASITEQEPIGPGKPIGHRKYPNRWSGNTYFEETIRRMRADEYCRELKEAERKRKLWKAFQKEIIKERGRDLLKSSGPGWWQEPSQKQISLAVTLEAVINADHEESVTGRTRQWLLDLGVTTRVTPKQVRGCMKRSLLDPIDFLLETHSLIVKLQLDEKKKKGERGQLFSINERLLLSAICVLHLPTLLIMLHYMLPPPKPFSSSKHIQELLFGDLNDDRIRYESPYMEPLPFRSVKHLHDWAFDKVFRALFPSIYVDYQKEFGAKAKPPKTMALAKKTIIGDAKQHIQNDRCIIKLPNNDTASITPSVAWLITKCMANRVVSPSLKPYVDEDSTRERYYRRRLTRKVSGAVRFSNNSSIIPPANDKKHNDDRLSPVDEISNYSESLHRNLHSGTATTSETGDKKRSSQYASAIGNAIEMDAAPYNIRFSEISHSNKPRKSTAIEYIATEEPEVVSVPSFDAVSTRNSVKPEETVKHFEQLPLPECDELDKIWNEMKDMPVSQQLKYSIKILAEMGDPLAQLPQLHKIPAVQRWFEIRQGKHRILSKSTKDQLLMSSRGMWKLAPAVSSKEGPKIKCSKRTERLLTWDSKKWLDSQIKTEMNNYFTRIKREKVDNARAFFPSMINHYDHGSKLNRNFRGVFYAYLPSREADTFVYKP